ncbi:MAG: hypothetical protein ABI162_12520 [Luteolibacter sp.]
MSGFLFQFRSSLQAIIRTAVPAGGPHRFMAALAQLRSIFSASDRLRFDSDSRIYQIVIAWKSHASKISEIIKRDVTAAMLGLH